ncbi:MAG: hypothetical protein KF764_01295 [Labilithrix sp.]|nr:hypothetical protein [Labilithrix sp.]MBX3225091.1 hypothetical protein [Labilithrix sp.]
MARSRLAALPLFVLLSLAALDGCSDDPTTNGADADAGTSDAASKEDGGGGGDTEGDSGDGKNERDAGKDSGDQDSGTCTGPIVTTPGETCVGFGAKAQTCDPACGQPYGYVCFDGAPPGFAGCRKASDSVLGQTYCCPTNACVAQPDQDAMCNGTAGKPRRFQCPPNGTGGNVAPPANCTEVGSGGSEVEKFYCCP